MHLLSLLTSSLLLAAPFVAANEASDVIDLTPKNFNSVVDGEALVLVEFFAPWCGHCKALAPHYEEAATALKAKSIKLAKVDCVAEADLCQQHGVQGYPTLKVFRNGTPTDYSGPRKADGIISYMVKQSLPAVTEVTSANYEEFKQADKVVVIAYVSSTTDAPAPVFSQVAEKHRDDWLFGLTSDSAVLEAAGVTAPAILVWRKFDDPRVDFPASVSSVTVDGLETFITENSMPLVDEVGPDNYAGYAGAGLPLAYLFLDPEDPKHAEYVAELKPVAQKHKGKVNFVYIDAIKFGDHGKGLNLQSGKWPAFVIHDMTKQLKYPMDESLSITKDSLEEFVDAYVAGTAQPKLKSEPVPESQDEPVFVLVGSQFEQVVYDDSKDVFVEFYAPWCGHCKRLKPTWDSLGEHYAHAKDRLTIAKMDATENDLPHTAPFHISSFPTLKFKPAGGREFLDYDGDRSLESLLEFVASSAKNDLEAKAPPPPESSAQVVVETPEAQHEFHDEL